QGDRGGGARGDRAVQGDGVLADGGGGGRWRQRLRIGGAGHQQVGAEGQVLPALGDEVGEDPVGAGAGQIDRDRPGAVPPERRVYVLEAGQVAADQDQVQVFVVAGGVAGEGFAPLVEDAQPQRRLGVRPHQRVLQVEGVAAVGDEQAAGQGVGCGGGLVVTVLT